MQMITLGKRFQIAQKWMRERKEYFSNSEGELYKNQFITFGIPKFYGADGAVKTGDVRYHDGPL